MKVIRCQDAGFDCKHVIRADTADEALKMAGDHAREVHGIKHIDKDTTKKIQSVMREE